MASLLYIFQQIFSEFQSASQSNDPSTYDCVNGTHLATNSPKVIPKDFPSLLTFFFSSSALREWFKILVYGSLLELSRRLVLYLYGKTYDSFFITATFDEDDVSYCKCPILSIVSVLDFNFFEFMQHGYVTGSLASLPGMTQGISKFPQILLESTPLL